MWPFPRMAKKIRKARTAAKVSGVLVSTLDAAPDEPITFFLDQNVRAVLFTGLLSNDAVAERRIRFYDRIAVCSYPWPGSFTPKIVYDDGEERILATIAVRRTDEEGPGEPIS